MGSVRRRGHRGSDPETSNTTPVKSFHIPQSPFQALLSLPSQIIFAFAILGSIGLANYARQIVYIVPAKPGKLLLRDEESDLKGWVEENVPSLRGSFTPTWWLPNGHLQTMFSVIGDFSKVDKVEYARTYLRIPDGGTIGLDFTPPHHAQLPDDTPTIVVCHGLTGGSHESYVRNVLAWAIKTRDASGLGVRAVVVNFRGCAGVPITSPQLYSAGTTLDLAISLHYLRSQFPRSPLHGIGFSLGASVLSRYLGESSSESLLSSGIVLGTPWDLPVMSIKLETHWFISRVYSTAMAKNLLNVFFRNYDNNPMVFEEDGSVVKPWLGKLKGLRGKRIRLKDVDEVMVSRFGGPRNIGLWPFNGADEYYQWASPKSVISGIKRPVLAINAFDDPIIDGASLPLDEFHASSHVYTAISGGGGHLGWFEGSRANTRWSLKPVAEWFEAATRDFRVEGKRVDLEKGVDGWVWGEEMAHEVSGIGEKEGGGGGRLGWKVLDRGEVVEGAEGEGPLQGL